MADVGQSLLALLRVALETQRAGDAEAIAGLSAADWKALYDLAARQGVLAMAWEGAEKADMLRNVPREVRIGWGCNVERIETLYGLQKQLIARLAELMNAQRIPMMILKGYALSLCYPTPRHRPCGDIDIWLYGKQAQADALLHEAWGVEIDRSKHHHTTFVADGVLVENHYDFLNLYAHASNRLCEQYLLDAARRPGTQVEVTACTGNGQTASGLVVRPPADLHALFLLRHTGAHFAAAHIGLRHLTDWALFITHHHNDIDWRQLTDIARELNTHRFLNCLNALSIDYLGINAAYVPSFERDAELEKRVLNEILSPNFAGHPPEGNALKSGVWRFRRWWANRWKHRIVYRENLLTALFRLAWSHAKKPVPNEITPTRG